MTIAEGIMRIRRDYDISQAALAQIAGVTDVSVSKWERGMTTPRVKAVKRIAEHFGVTPAYVMGFENDTSRDEELLEAYHAADLKTKNTVRYILGLPELHEVKKRSYRIENNIIVLL